MSRPPRLARLDARLVPRLGRLLRGVGTLAQRAVGVTGAPGRFVGRSVRRNPTVTAAVVAVAGAAALIIVTGGDHHRAVAPAIPTAAEVLPGDVLGPAAGQQVSDYLTSAQQRLKTIAAADPTAPLTAVVDLTGYLTADAVTNELSGLDGVQVIRAFARVAPPAIGDVHTITLLPGSDLASDLAVVQAQAHTIVVNYHKRVALARINPTPQNDEVVTAYAAEAQQAKIDAGGIGATAGCVFALVVTGPLAALQQLAADPDVRVLDPAPPSEPQASLMIVPLEPQVTGPVSPLAFAGD